MFCFLFIDLEYTKISNKRCSSSRGTFTSYETAKEECFFDEKCQGFFDPGCMGSYFRKCLVGSDYIPDQSVHTTPDCLYEKPSKISTFVL